MTRQIFGYLPKESRDTVYRVCKAWRNDYRWVHPLSAYMLALSQNNLYFARQLFESQRDCLLLSPSLSSNYYDIALAFADQEAILAVVRSKANDHFALTIALSMALDAVGTHVTLDLLVLLTSEFGSETLWKYNRSTKIRDVAVKVAASSAARASDVLAYMLADPVAGKELRQSRPTQLLLRAINANNDATALVLLKADGVVLGGPSTYLEDLLAKYMPQTLQRVLLVESHFDVHFQPCIDRHDFPEQLLKNIDKQFGKDSVTTQVFGQIRETVELTNALHILEIVLSDERFRRDVYMSGYLEMAVCGGIRRVVEIVLPYCHEIDSHNFLAMALQYKFYDIAELFL